MKEITLYECEYCGRRYDSKEFCESCESSHGNLILANNMLKEGKTLSDINVACCLWDRIPVELLDLSIRKAYTRYGEKKRTGTGRVVVAITEDLKLLTAKVAKYLKGTQAYSLADFNEHLKYNEEESEYMGFLYDKFGEKLFKNI